MRAARKIAVLFGLLAGLASPLLVPATLGQDGVEIPPLPRPRPDRDNAAPPVATPPETSAA